MKAVDLLLLAVVLGLVAVAVGDLSMTVASFAILPVALWWDVKR